MSFKILDATHSAERMQWLELWQRWPDREVYAHPGYVEILAELDQKALCAVWEGDSGCVLFPLLRRPLSSLPWADVDNKTGDLTNAYGYGGPYAWSVRIDEAVLFWQNFDCWAQEENLVSTFARLSLFNEQLAMPEEGVQEEFLNVVRYLDVDEDILWMDYAHKVRKNVKRARRDGVRIVVDKTGEKLEDFLDIYYGTMQRRKAADGYYLPREFFANIVSNLTGKFVFFHALLDDEIISTELVLLSKRYMYSYLGGTRSEAFVHRPNDLLKHEAIQWGRVQGKHAFVLGGGYGREDGIYRYKLGFAPQGQKTFRVLRRVQNRHLYQELVDRRCVYEARQGRNWKSSDSFFPAYRAPSEV